jgi:AcrR family transcriptional regulator
LDKTAQAAHRESEESEMARAARSAPEGDGAETRDRILGAALRSFTEKGFDGASVRDIATRAGVNHGLIQYHYGGKLRLWQAAVDHAFARLRDGLEAVLADPRVVDERQRMRLLIRNYVRFVAANPEFVLLMHEEGKRRGPRMRWLVDRHAKPLYHAVTRLALRARERGLLPRDIPPVHFHYILAGSVGLFFHQAPECQRLTGVDPFDPGAVEQHARAVETLLMGPPENGETIDD